MKEVSILISNYNSFEAIQLCIESVVYHTQGRPYQIIVYDDCSNNDIDLPYLRCQQDKGALKLIEGKEKAMHGGALNILVNEVCHADLAVMLDCDTHIIEDGWLEKLIALIEADDKAIGICNCYGIRMRNPVHWLAPFCEWWFGMLNMNAYRDGMRVDWRPTWSEDPAIIKAYVDACVDNPFKDEGLEPQVYSFDVGCKFYHKILTDNPKGYHIISPLPEDIAGTFVHHRQVSHQASGLQPQHIQKYVSAKLAIMRNELQAIRKETAIHEVR